MGFSAVKESHERLGAGKDVVVQKLNGTDGDRSPDASRAECKQAYGMPSHSAPYQFHSALATSDLTSHHEEEATLSVTKSTNKQSSTRV